MRHNKNVTSTGVTKNWVKRGYRISKIQFCLIPNKLQLFVFKLTYPYKQKDTFAACPCFLIETKYLKLKILYLYPLPTFPLLAWHWLQSAR